MAVIGVVVAAVKDHVEEFARMDVLIVVLVAVMVLVKVVVVVPAKDIVHIVQVFEL